MVKHILGKAFWMCTCLFVCMFAGEHFIVEPNVEWRYERADSKFVYPGRAYTRKGEPLYAKYEKDGASRHMTFIFTMFVLMQIINMIPARKIRDEINIFEGFFTNWMFLGIMIGVLGGQILITQVTGVVFKVHPKGLHIIQWAEAAAISTSILIVDFVLKLLPDDIAPKLGQDSQDERRIAQRRGRSEVEN